MPVQSAEELHGQTVINYAGPPGATAMPPVRGGDVLACGFAMTVAAWIVAYLSRMPLVNAPGQVTVLAMLAMVFIGGILAARYSPRGTLAALAAGLLSGLLDILVIGSILHDVSPGQSVAPAASLWISGSILLNGIVAFAGGIIGHFFPSPQRGQIRWTAVFAVILAVATLPLITAGGLVTAFRAGLAVPDWPQSYGYNMFLFPLSRMQSAQGNFYEHAHRLMGSLVGLGAIGVAEYTTIVERQWRRTGVIFLFGIHLTVLIALALFILSVKYEGWYVPIALGVIVGLVIIWTLVRLWLKEPRGWVIVFSWLIFFCVCAQGVLGGTRVTERSVPLAVIHGVFAQLVFAAMASLAAASSRSFDSLSIPPPADFSAGERRKDLWLPALLVGAMIFQITLGALVRHFDMLVLVHVIVACVVALLGVTCGFRAWVYHGDSSPLRRTGIAILIVLSLQLILGVIAWVMRPGTEGTPTPLSAAWTTAHQANGALLMALCVVLCLWHGRSLGPMSDKITE